MPWLATGASVCGALKPLVRTEISLRAAGADELDRDLVDGVPLSIMRCLRSWAPAHRRLPRPGVFR